MSNDLKYIDTERQMSNKYYRDERNMVAGFSTTTKTRNTRKQKNRESCTRTEKEGIRTCVESSGKLIDVKCFGFLGGIFACLLQSICIYIYICMFGC
jgi:hypothetical protein